MPQGDQQLLHMILDHVLAAVRGLAPGRHLLLGSQLLRLLVCMSFVCSTCQGLGTYLHVRHHRSASSAALWFRSLADTAVISIAFAGMCIECRLLLMVVLQEPGLAIASAIREEALRVLHVAMLQATRVTAQVGAAISGRQCASVVQWGGPCNQQAKGSVPDPTLLLLATGTNPLPWRVLSFVSVLHVSGVSC